MAGARRARRVSVGVDLIEIPIEPAMHAYEDLLAVSDDGAAPPASAPGPSTQSAREIETGGAGTELAAENIQAELTKLGLSDRIVDLVSSGRTLAENGLEVIEPICDISARLVINRASYQIKRQSISELIQLLAAVIPL